MLFRSPLPAFSGLPQLLPDILPDAAGADLEGKRKFLLDDALHLPQCIPVAGGQPLGHQLPVEAAGQKHQLPFIPTGDDLLKTGLPGLAIQGPGNLLIPDASDDGGSST